MVLEDNRPPVNLMTEDEYNEELKFWIQQLDVCMSAYMPDAQHLALQRLSQFLKLEQEVFLKIVNRSSGGVRKSFRVDMVVPHGSSMYDTASYIRDSIVSCPSWANDDPHFHDHAVRQSARVTALAPTFTKMRKALLGGKD